MNDEKTEQKIFVSGINCEPKIARTQMMRTKKAFNKEDGIVAFHGYQSFKPGEVTPELAHQIGMELAQKMWGDEYEVIVASHLNTGAIHNHICINSVSYIDGHKYDERNSEWQRMAKLSDEICLAHGLSIIENPKFGRTLPHDEYMAAKNGTPTMDELIKKDIDDCIASSMTRAMFYKEMQKRGYTFDLTHKYATVKHKDFSRTRRLKTLGRAYTIEAIEDRITGKWIPEFKEDHIENTDKLFLQEFPNTNYPRFQYVFKRYVWELEFARKHPWYNNRYLYLVKEDLKKLERFSEEQDLIISNDIKSTADIDLLISAGEEKIRQLTDARQKLRNKLKTAVTNNDEAQIRELKDDISDYGKLLKISRKEIKVAERIKIDVEHVTANTEKIEQRNKEFEEKSSRKNNTQEKYFNEYMK